MSKAKAHPRSNRGIAYTEVLISAIILSILMVSALKLFSNLGRSQQNTVNEKIATQLASQMIEEIKVLPYRDPVATDEIGPGIDEIGPDRSAFDDIDDYDGWSAQPPQDKQGNPLSRYPNLSRSVTVSHVASNDFNQQVVDDEGYKKVIVKISRDTQANVILQREYIIADIYSTASEQTTTKTGGTESKKF